MGVYWSCCITGKRVFAWYRNFWIRSSGHLLFRNTAWQACLHFGVARGHGLILSSWSSRRSGCRSTRWWRQVRNLDRFRMQPWRKLGCKFPLLQKHLPNGTLFILLKDLQRWCFLGLGFQKRYPSLSFLLQTFLSLASCWQSYRQLLACTQVAWL